MHLKVKIPLFIVIAIVLITSCNNRSLKGPIVEKENLPPVDVDIHRYGQELFSIDTTRFQSELENIHDEYILFLGKNISDPQITKPLYEYITDTAIISIANKVIEDYPDLSALQYNLEDAFSRYLYFFPGFKIPDVYTYVSNLYFEKPVIYYDSTFIIGLDLYLGPDFQPYRTVGLPYYMIRRMTPEKIEVDVMTEIYNVQLKEKIKINTLVDAIIEGGKLLYYLDATLPDIPDSTKIGYTSLQIKWIEKNKKNLWAFMVNNELFYSSDFKVINNFTKDGPFTSGFSNDSPPMTGLWLGWQIVRKYMDKYPEVTLQDLISEKDHQKIFNKSGYKP